eukprot:5331-Heterococcus_DN1.PRE.4
MSVAFSAAASAVSSALLLCNLGSSRACCAAKGAVRSAGAAASRLRLCNTAVTCGLAAGTTNALAPHARASTGRQ